MNVFKKIRKITYVLVLYFFATFLVSASHIKAGEFSAQKDPNDFRTYTITLTLYYNTLGGAADNPTVDIYFGDGQKEPVTRQPKIDVGNNPTKNTFVVRHSYSGSSTYIVSMSESFRNASIENIPASNSTDFYVEMQLQVTSFIGLDNLPVMTVPPIDFGMTGKIFTHNPGAYDIDGDSLSYELIPSQSDLNKPIPGYSYPSDPKFNGHQVPGPGPAYIDIDPATGDITWNSPSGPYAFNNPRFYNIAIKITEWRLGRAIGYVIRDMQVEIRDEPNKPPVLNIPKTVCVEANVEVRETFSATDPDVDRNNNPTDNIILEHFGETFAITPNTATVVYTGQGGKTPSGLYTWTPGCAQVRAQPYNVVCKATDQSTVTHLTDIQTWQIFVKGPKIKNVVATPGTSSIVLKWSLYSCSSSADSIKIYRRDCDSVSPPDPCKTGVLAGYTYIGHVRADSISFTDNNNGKGLDKGKSYCYILVAKYKFPGFGESVPSQQVCTQLNRDVPVFSTINVDQTSTTAGIVFLNWYPPSTAFVTPPFMYQIERSSKSNPAFTAIGPIISDTFYFDNNLNTKNEIYTYRILLKNNNMYTGTIPVMDLTAVAGNAKVTLNWKYGTPWATDSVEVYRKINSGSFIKIQQFNASTLSYTDNSSNGVKNCDTLYYKVKQYGSYCDKELSKVAVQTSAIDSVRPLDDTPPVAPKLSVQGCNGDLTVFKDILNWTDLSNDLCNTIDHYNVYFAPHDTDDPSLLLSLNDTNYTYINAKTTAGCFVVSATNKAGIEGAKSEKICVDDCVYYELPNLITINNDGKNDTFYPFDFPRGVAYVKFYVYNIWGDLMYVNDQDANIHWDGSSYSGKVDDGLYYFLADITYYGRLKKDDENRKIKGWVQVIRSN